MRKLISVITICSLVLLNIISISAASSEVRLYDYANLFTSDECVKINEMLLNTENEVGFNVALATRDDFGDLTDPEVTDFADIFYENLFGMNTDGIILVLDNSNGEKRDRISTSGNAIYIFTDDRIEELFDYFYDFLIDEDYFGAAENYTYGIKKIAARSKTDSKPIAGEGGYYVDYNEYNPSFTVIGIIISCIIAAVIIITTKNRYTVKAVKNAVNYLDRGSIKYYQHTDTFIRRRVSKTRIQHDSGGHGGGGGRSGGGFSSTHTSSSGGTHGGGGRSR